MPVAFPVKTSPHQSVDLKDIINILSQPQPALTALTMFASYCRYFWKSAEFYSLLLRRKPDSVFLLHCPDGFLCGSVQRGTAVVCSAFPEACRSRALAVSQLWVSLWHTGGKEKLRISENTCQLLHHMILIPKDLKE